MQVADESMTNQALGRSTGKVYVSFSMEPRKDNAASLEAGRPVFKEVPYIQIMVPGDKDNIVMRPVRQTDKEKYPDQWRAFEANQEQHHPGTPLSEWPIMTRSMVEELKYFNVFTVEGLVDMPDSLSQKFMGIASLKEKARDYIEAAKGLSQVNELRTALETRDRMIDTLRHDLEELGGIVAELKGAKLTAAQKKKLEQAEEVLSEDDADER